jgi:hypothetical protein
MIHAKFSKPRWFSWNSNREPEQINRLQEISKDLALNRDKQYEIGRVDLLDYRKKTPSLTKRLRQFENGDMSFWYDLANKENPGTGDDHYVTLEDFKNTIGDIAYFLTDDDNTFTGTQWIPKVRVSGFSLNIGDPEAIVERNFNVVGENDITLPDNYLAYAKKIVGAGSGAFADTVVLDGATGNPPVPVAYASSKYIFRVLRIRSGQVSELIEDETLSPAVNTWGYNNSTKTVTVQDCETGDILKVYYESATAYTTTWTDDNVDATMLLAEYCEIYIKFTTSNKIYRLQSIGIDATLTRTDYGEIGTFEKVQYGVKDQTVRISLNRYLQGFALEDIFAGETAYPYVNPMDFVDDLQILVKVYGERAHTNFKIGYLMTKVSPTTLGNTLTVQDYLKATNSLECDNVKISDTESEVAFI